MQRGREERLGFRFVLRMVAQAMANEDWGRFDRWTSFEYFEREDIADSFRHAARLRDEDGLGDGMGGIWDRCVATARALRASLVDELGCDDFRRIPRGFGFQPIVQLLVRFPDQARLAADDGVARQELAGLLLLRAIAGRGRSSEERELINGARSAKTWAEGVAAIRALDAEGGLRRFFQENATTQARPAQLLYWLLRRTMGARTGARDFAYGVNGVLEGQSQRQVFVGANCECQHMLPAKKLAAILHPERPARGAAPTSRLGNLTWISAELNGFSGLGDQVVRLDAEEPANVSAHAYDFEVAGRPAVDEFMWLAEQLGLDRTRTNPRRFKARYRRFCEAREQEVVKRFREWLTQLSSMEPAVAAPAPGALPPPDAREFEQAVMERWPEGDPLRRLLLSLSVRVLRPAVESKRYLLHAHSKKRAGRFFLQQHEPGSRANRKRGGDSLLVIDLDKGHLRRGESAHAPELMDALCSTFASGTLDRVQLSEAVRHGQFVADRISAFVRRP